MDITEQQVVVTVPSKRKPPLRTLELYMPQRHKLLLISDPEFFDEHRQYARKWDNVCVMKGTRGMGAQIWNCYREAALFGFPYFLRMDDDLPEHSFIHRDGHEPTVEELIWAAYSAAIRLGVSLVGFNNTTNRFWMQETAKYCYSNIYGAINFAQSTVDPDQFINPLLRKKEIEYRICTHRRRDKGFFGKVSYIGVNYGLMKNRPTVNHVSVEEHNLAIDIILEKFPDMIHEVESDGPIKKFKFHQSHPRRTK